MASHIISLVDTNGSTNGVSLGDARPERKTVYLVTGASRGIGKGLVAAYLLLPHSIVIACVRTPSTAAPTLSSLPTHPTSSLIVQELDCSSTTSTSLAVSSLAASHGITHLDVVIANAAIAANFGPASTMTLAALESHMMVNTYSVLLLFQGAKPLLEKGRDRKFVYIGAPISTITDMEECKRAPLGAYSVSKLATNWLVRKWHYENEWLVAFVVDPGHVQTDMGDQGARLMGRKEAPTTLEDSVRGICTRITEATKEKTSGQFVCHENGETVPW